MAAATGLPELEVAGALTGATRIGGAGPARAIAGRSAATAAAELTTLAQTLGPGPAGIKGYRPVISRPGEAHLVRTELARAQPGRNGRRVSLLALAHLTDQHIVDVESPGRVEFLDRYADGPCASAPFSAAHRPHEAASARITDSMVRRLRRIAVSPVTGAAVTAAVCTGDNTDNVQTNELQTFLGLMDGGRVTPGSGNLGAYEGVQASGDLAYWHPDPAVRDTYKTGFGYPDSPGFLERALAPFDAAGVGTPWYSCFGNHDGLAQGNAPVNPALARITTGSAKVVGLAPGADPCASFAGLGAAPAAPVRVVTPDAGRSYLSRKDWIGRHLTSPGLPAGHGFTAANAAGGTAYYATDVGPLRFIVLDTVNPGGSSEGSLGDRQLQWLTQRLTEADRDQRLVLLFSHHGPRSLTNPARGPDPLDPAGSDLPRHTADDVLGVVGRFRSVIAWVNGHTHENIVTPRGSFWDVGTAAHIDWPAQSRLVEVVDNRDGTLSIFGTMVDHDGDDVTGLARELCGNDPQYGYAKGTGQPEDRNVELLIVDPFPSARGRTAGGTGTANAGAGATAGASTSAGLSPRAAALPATGLPPNLSIGGALAVAGALGVRALLRRPPGPTPGGESPLA